MGYIGPICMQNTWFTECIFSNITLYSHDAVISVWFFFLLSSVMSCLPCWLCIFFISFLLHLFTYLFCVCLWGFFIVWMSVLCCFRLVWFVSFFLLLQELAKGFQWWPLLWKEVPMSSPLFWSTCETLPLFLLWYVMAVAEHLTSLPLATNILKKEGKSFHDIRSFSIHRFNSMVKRSTGNC